MLLSPSAEDIARLVVEEKVPVVTTGAGNPGKGKDSGDRRSGDLYRSPVGYSSDPVSYGCVCDAVLL